MLPLGEAAVRGELAEDGGAPGADPGPAQAGSHTQEAGGARRSDLNLTRHSFSNNSSFIYREPQPGYRAGLGWRLGIAQEKFGQNEERENGKRTS